MKHSLIILSLVACLLTEQAQGTLPFAAVLAATNEIPPNSDPTVCTGYLWLTGNSLSFQVDVIGSTFNSVYAYIQGPASSGSNAPIIFDLGRYTFQGGSPEFGIPPTFDFFSPFDGVFGAGPFTLSTNQISELERGLWYLNVTSETMTNGQVRGQILLQPQATLSSPVLTNNSVQFIVSQVATLRYVVQANTKLGASDKWVSLMTNFAPFTFIDKQFTNVPRRFYRAIYYP